MGKIDAGSSQILEATSGKQYLTFSLGHEEYGVEILKVQEIKGNVAVRPIPNTPQHVRGVMDLRGMIIPVVDLRSRFSLAEADRNQFTVIIVVRVRDQVIGLVVDGVSDVLDVAGRDIQATPDFGAHVDARFIDGITKAGEKLVVLLDIETVVGGVDVAPIGSNN